MKVRCDILLDLESGDYEMSLHNLSQPGAPMDYLRIRAALDRVIGAVDVQSGADARRAADPSAEPRSLGSGARGERGPARPKPRRR